MAGLDYRVSGESGALVVHTHSLSWHRAKSPNITIPPPDRGWDRSAPVRPTGKLGGRKAREVDGQPRDKQVSEKAPLETIK